MGDFKRLSLGGYGGLRYIKSIWVDSPGPGDKTPRLVVSNGNVYCRVGARKRDPFHFRWLSLILFSKSKKQVEAQIERPGILG